MISCTAPGMALLEASGYPFAQEDAMTDQSAITELTADIVSAYVANNAVSADDVPRLCQPKLSPPVIRGA